MAEKYDSQIAAKQKELETYKQDLEAIKQQFIKDSSAFVANWYEETAKSYVISESANTLKIGKERLSEMKLRVSELKAKAEKIVNEILSNPSLWWHLSPESKEISNYPYEQYDVNRMPEILDKPLRRALGLLGAILGDYGYNVTTKISYSISPVSWLDTSIYTYGKPPVLFYPNAFACSNEMFLTLKRYNETYKKAFSAYHEVRRLQLEKQNLQASALWGSA